MGEEVAVGPVVVVGNKVVVGPDVTVGDEVKVGPDVTVGDEVGDKVGGGGLGQSVTAHHGPHLLVGSLAPLAHAVRTNIAPTFFLSLPHFSGVYPPK